MYFNIIPDELLIKILKYLTADTINAMYIATNNNIIKYSQYFWKILCYRDFDLSHYKLETKKKYKYPCISYDSYMNHMGIIKGPIYGWRTEYKRLSSRYNLSLYIDK